jgi:hypothetical protein
MQKNKYTKDCLYVICLLVDGGFNTYGGFTGEQLEAKALIYSTILLEDADMDNEIIKLTGMRYLKGEVTVYRDGCHVPVSHDFPTAPEFYQACKQTYAALYRNIVIGETERDGIPYAHTLKVRRDLDPNTLDMMVKNERRRLGLRIEEKSKPLSHDQERKASEIIRRVFGDAPKLNKDGQE